MWISLLLLLPLVTADYFKETQDFKYSRSDGKGEQKGFYGAQTGNMGGNYEVAHNMDNVAEHQMKNLMHQVGGQLGIDPLAIGTGHTPVAMGSGSIYGSASASGKSVQKGLQTDFDSYGAAQNSRLGSGYSSTHGDATGGAIRGSQQFSNYDGYGASRQDNLRHQTLGVQSANENAHHSAARYGSGSRHSESTVNNFDATAREHGERYGSSATNFQSENHYGQQAGLHSVAADSQHAIGGSTGSRAIGGSQHVSAGSQHATSNAGYQKSFGTYGVTESQNAGTIIHPVPLGGAVKLVVRPGQTVTTIPIRVPVQPSETNKLQSGYVQSSTFGASGSHGQNIHSDSQVYGGRNVDETQGSRVVGVGIGNGQDRTNAAKGYESSFSYTKEWEKHGTSATRPNGQVQYISVPSVRPTNSETIDNIETSGSHDSSRTSYGTNYHSGQQNAGRSRDKLSNTYVNLGKNVEDSQYGSRQGSASANQYQSSYSTQKEWENQHKGEAWNANSNLARSNDRLSTAHVGATDSEGMGIHDTGSTLQTGGRPKSYQSSYSYSKSWESRGTPRTTVGGGNLESQRHGATYTIPYSEHVGSAESLYGSTGQQNMRYSGSSSSSGQNLRSSSHGSQAGEVTVDMDSLQQQLKSRMNEMCPTCGEAKTKGYSASYSYSAQRGYGGSQAGHENLRRKRRVDNRRGELDEYENISIQNKIADYKNWEEQVKDLRMRVKNMIHKLSNEDKKVETSPTKKTSDSMHSYRSKSKSNIDRDVELIENDDVQDEIKDINELKNKVSDLRKKVQALLHVQEEDNTLKREIEVLNKKIGDFESHVNHPKKDINSKRRNIREVNFEQETEYLGQQTEDLGQQTEDLGRFVDLGQQTEDLKQGDFYLGQQTQDFGQSSLQFGQETQNYKETSHAGQQTHHLGQETEVLGQSTLQLESEGQNYRDVIYGGGQQTQDYKETGYAGQHLGQQTEDLGQSTLQLGSEAQNYKVIYGGQQTEDLGQSTLDLGQETQHIGQQSNDKFSGGQQTYAGQQTSRTGQESFYIGRDRQTQNQLHEDSDLGQQTLQVDDWPQNGELQVAQRETVSINNNLNRAEINRNRNVVEKQEVAPATTTENPGFWKNVGSKAKSWFG
ncbi:uncharacterized protein LOC143917464 isoform X2 [Arctopsyche grandis]|uniref:uncharacterized protein LOC143917464 isoform X2 n=1 Tax=Arctopsyche grandis TaxID=121162 RepID=UPI00406D71FE